MMMAELWLVVLMMSVASGYDDEPAWCFYFQSFLFY